MWGALELDWSVEALATAGAADRTETEKIEEPISAATVGEVKGLCVAVRAGFSV
jgi:hypothetical protein